MTIQDAIYRTIHKNRIRPKAIAAAMGLTQSTLYDIADARRERRLRAEEIPALVMATCDTTVLDALEAQVGRIAFDVPPGLIASTSGPRDARELELLIIDALLTRVRQLLIETADADEGAATADRHYRRSA